MRLETAYDDLHQKNAVIILENLVEIRRFQFLCSLGGESGEMSYEGVQQLNTLNAYLEANQ